MLNKSDDSIIFSIPINFLDQPCNSLTNETLTMQLNIQHDTIFIHLLKNKLWTISSALSNFTCLPDKLNTYDCKIYIIIAFYIIIF